MKSYVKQEKYLIQDIFSSTTYVRLILKWNCLKDVKTFSITKKKYYKLIN